MDKPRDYHAKSERERQILYNSTYTQNLKNNTSELIHKIAIENKFIVNKGERGARMGKLGVWH